jgi:hypothetical protein
MGMVINWSAVATIAAPIIALFAGVWINRRFESRAVLISYFGHVASISLTFDRINTGIQSDEGFARQIPLLLQRVYPKWFNLMMGALVLLGLISLVYVAFYFARRLVF